MYRRVHREKGKYLCSPFLSLCCVSVLLIFFICCPLSMTFLFRKAHQYSTESTVHSEVYMCKQLAKKTASLQDSRCLQISTDTTITNRPRSCVSNVKL